MPLGPARLLPPGALGGALPPDVVLGDDASDDGGPRRTATFNVSAVSNYAVKIVGGANSAAEPFHVAEMIEYANT